MPESLEDINYLSSITPQQRSAAELKALEPGISYKEIADRLGVHHQTVFKWFKNPMIIDATYDRFMEVAGNRLITVLDAMIREAERGSVPAAQLVLKHWGKLQETIHIKIESPFEKFLKISDAEFEVVDSEESTLELISQLPITEELPDRDLKNNKPHARVYRQKGRLRQTVRSAKRKAKRHESYKLRLRALAVGLDLLPSGRPRRHEQRRWLDKLEQMELDQGIAVDS